MNLLLARRGRPASSALVTAVLAIAFAVATVPLAAPAAATEIVTLPSSGSVTVYGKGNGHGHGMSQYGSQGAAIAGLTAGQIVGFYYPGTTLTNLGATTIRVLVGGAGTYPTVVAQSGLALYYNGANHALPSSGISRFRLVPSGGGLALQKLTSAWADVARYASLPRQADFNNVSTAVVRLARSDGQYNDYRGWLGGYNSGGGVWAINRVSLDQYTQGVVPRESPSSWRSAALQAQAIAARTYGRNAVESHTGSAYDICDTTDCQVYGGLARLSSGGTRLYGEEPSTNAATVATANQVLRYNGTTIFAQFSASDGGWTSYGGSPYLPHQADPYDNAASGDPYLNWTRSVAVSAIASSFGLSRATTLEITQREGGGMWGGRVLQAYVNGYYPSGNAAHISMSIDTMRFLFGGGRSNWFDVVPPGGGGLPPVNGGSLVGSTATSRQAFWTSPDGHVTFREWTPSTGWRAAVDLGAPVTGKVLWDPGAATPGGGHLDLAVRDAAGHLATRSYSVTSGWTAWRTTALAMASSPAAVDPVAGELDLYYRGADSRLYHVSWTEAGGWSAAGALPGISNAASGPDAVATVAGTTRQSVTYRGSDGNLWLTSYSPSTGWGTPARVNPARPIPAPMAALDPGLGGNGATNPSVYYTGKDGVVYHCAYTVSTGAWSVWYAVPGTGVTSAPAAWTADSSVTLFAQYHAAMATQGWDPTHGWRVWMPI
jgi:stage II sporulation protein D